MDSVLKKLNDINRYSSATNISVGDLTIGEKYRVVLLEKVSTKYGVSIVAYITKVGEEELCRIYLPKKFVDTFDETFITQFNKNEMGELHLEYKGIYQKSFNIAFS